MSIEAMNFWMIILSTIVFGIINYILSSLAIYTIAKKQKIKNPWLAWVPIGNSYMFIKVGEGKMIFLILAIASLAGGSYLRPLQNDMLSIIGMALNFAWLIYGLTLLNKLCNKYNVNILFFVAGLIAPLFMAIPKLAGLYMPIMLISFYGYWKLYRNAAKQKEGKLVIESKTVFSKKR